MKILLTVVGEIIAVVIIGLIFIYSGIYNVSALNQDTGIKAWVLGTVMDNSVEHHSKSIIAPALENPTLIKIGVEHYKEMCETCHGAPGVKPSVIGRGLNPEAPDLAESVVDISDAQLFWIIKNGIKMTGMPAFAKTHSDQEIWAMVSFVKTLPKTTAAQYQEMTQGLPSGEEEEKQN